MSVSRRQMCLLLPTLLASVSGNALEQQAEKPLLKSEVFPFAEMAVHRQRDDQFRPVLDGATHSGFAVEIHETTLSPGAQPHPPHHHMNEEIFLMREGVLDVTLNGKTSRIGPGSVAYVASNVQHGVRNSGETPAQYFVIALGA